MLGDEHLITLSSRSNLVWIYREQGRYIEAEELCLQVLETSKRVLGDEHPITWSCRFNLVEIYRKQGRHIEAEELSNSGALHQ